MRRQPLGKGLDAILGNGAEVSDAVQAPPPLALLREDDPGTVMVEIERIVAGREQPRRRFNDAGLDELTASIREQGIIQPLVVTRRPGGYELIAGERRLRAAARAGLERVPVVVRPPAAESELLELALVENIQREDLDALERARAYQRLIEAHGNTQEQVARRVGKSRTAVANTLRLLALPEPVRSALEEGQLSEGHARALLALPTAASQISACRIVVQKGLSVRETEELVKGQLQSSAGGNGDRRRSAVKPTASPIEVSLSRSLGTKVRLRGTEGKGRIEIEYYSKEELTRLMDRLAR